MGYSILTTGAGRVLPQCPTNSSNVCSVSCSSLGITIFLTDSAILIKLSHVVRYSLLVFGRNACSWKWLPDLYRTHTRTHVRNCAPVPVPMPITRWHVWPVPIPIPMDLYPYPYPYPWVRIRTRTHTHTHGLVPVPGPGKIDFKYIYFFYTFWKIYFLEHEKSILEKKKSTKK